MSPLLLLVHITGFLFFSPAISGVTITHLPGFSGALPFHLETGYETVDSVEFFYYFIQSERNAREDPLLVWLSGGPGCSAFCGLVFEIGPLKFVTVEYNGSLPSLVYNPYSWTKIANIIFLDSPVGAGFSFSRSTKGYEVGDTTSSIQVYKFLIQWHNEHPQFLSNPLYIGGDSYAGKIVPVVTHVIAEGNDGPPFFNLKGYLVGNPITGELMDINSQVPYAHRVGIISDKLYKVIEGHCQVEDYANPNPNNSLCYNALGKFNQFYSEIDPLYILGPKCVYASPKPKDMIGDRRSLGEKYADFLVPPSVPDVKCRSYAYYLSYYWANNNVIREALHIKKDTVREWVWCNRSLPYTMDIPSSVKYHLDLTRQGYRALVYSGDQDLVIPFVGTQAWIKSLNFRVLEHEDWRSWHVDGQVAGYTRKYTNDFTFATVKNAGHTAPEYQPRNCLVMLDRWISGKHL